MTAKEHSTTSSGNAALLLFVFPPFQFGRLAPMLEEQESNNHDTLICYQLKAGNRQGYVCRGSPSVCAYILYIWSNDDKQPRAASLTQKEADHFNHLGHQKHSRNPVSPFVCYFDLHRLLRHIEYPTCELFHRVHKLFHNFAWAGNVHYDFKHSCILWPKMMQWELWEWSKTVKQNHELRDDIKNSATLGTWEWCDKSP